MMLGNIPMPGRPIIGPIALAVGAGWGRLDIFLLVFFSLSILLLEDDII